MAILTQPNSSSPNHRVIAPSDSVALLDGPCRGIYVGGTGDVVVIAANDANATISVASSANAATLTLANGAAPNLPQFSSGTPGQYIITNDGTHNAEIISGWISAAGVLTVTTGGGSGGNTAQYAHNAGTVIAPYTIFKAVPVGAELHTQARWVMNTNTSATLMLALY